MNVLDDSIVFGLLEPSIYEKQASSTDNVVSVLGSWMKPKSVLSSPEGLISQAIQAVAQMSKDDQNTLYLILINQYIEDVRYHFMKHAAPLLKAALNGIEYTQQTSSPGLHPSLEAGGILMEGKNLDPHEIIPRLVALITSARSHYLYPLSFLPELPDALYASVNDAYIALTALTLPIARLSKLIKVYLSSVVLANATQDTIHTLQTLQEVTGVVINSNSSSKSRSNFDQDTGKLLQSEILKTFILDVALVLTQKYGKMWDREMATEIEQWSNETLTPTAVVLFANSDDNTTIEQNLKRLTKDILLEIRTQELFDIVVDYPDSLPAIHDMKSFLHTPTQRAAIVSSMQQSCSKRLLHGGANTVDVLAWYVSLIRVFAILEPRGVLLHKIARPIRRYLKEREDTIREVLSGLLGDKRSPIKDLASELIGAARDDISVPTYVPGSEEPKNEAAATKEKEKKMKSSLKTLLKDPEMNWIPDPMDAPPDFQTDNKTFDVISNLVSVFDNKDVLVKELMKRFADTMVFSHEFDEETMLMTIELLKLKFGEDALANLDVMIKDMAESKRIDHLVHVQSGKRTNSDGDTNMEGNSASSGKVEDVFHADVISKLFWPKYNVTTCRAPKAIEEYVSF